MRPMVVAFAAGSYSRFLGLRVVFQAFVLKIMGGFPPLIRARRPAPTIGHTLGPALRRPCASARGSTMLGRCKAAPAAETSSRSPS
jgi:hypothetical protein